MPSVNIADDVVINDCEKTEGGDIVKKYVAFLLVFVMTGMLTACGNSSTANQPNSANAEILLENESEDSDSSQSDGKVLVAYFAYSENIGDTSDMEIDAVSSASLNRKTSNEAGNL